MATIPTISSLLSLSGSQYRVFDIGRRICKIKKSTFEQIENNQLPYPYPVNGCATMAIVFWQKSSQQPFLWFVKLPLDERGLLNQGARNHFIAIIIEALGANLTEDVSDKQEELLKANPYLITPSQYKLASLNSMISVELHRSPSQYYNDAKRYFSGKLGWKNWQNVGIQGIADFSARLNYDGNANTLANAFKFLPIEVLTPLCSSIENHVIPLEVLEIMHSFLMDNASDNINLTCLILRAVSSNNQHPYITDYVDSLLNTNDLETDVAIVIASRCWELLEDQTRMMKFVELLAKKRDQMLFTALFKDLIAIPLLRPILLSIMRSTKRSNALVSAIGQLMTGK